MPQLEMTEYESLVNLRTS